MPPRHLPIHTRHALEMFPVDSLFAWRTGWRRAQPGRKSIRLGLRGRFERPFEEQPAQGGHGEPERIRATHMGHGLCLNAAQVTHVRAAINSRVSVQRLYVKTWLRHANAIAASRDRRGV